MCTYIFEPACGYTLHFAPCQDKMSCSRSFLSLNMDIVPLKGTILKGIETPTIQWGPPIS